jgi:hypothetical protein
MANGPLPRIAAGGTYCMDGALRSALLVVVRAGRRPDVLA